MPSSGHIGQTRLAQVEAPTPRSPDCRVPGTIGCHTALNCSQALQRASTPYYTRGPPHPTPSHRIYLLLLLIVQHIHKLDHIPMPQPPQQLDLPATTEDIAQLIPPAVRSLQGVVAQMPIWEHTGQWGRWGWSFLFACDTWLSPKEWTVT